MRLWYAAPQGHNISLFALMPVTGNSAASDLRDRVYGVLGLASVGDRLLLGPPTYTESVEVLYTRIVVANVKHWKHLDDICYAELFPNSGREEPIPSWVPDWRNNTQAFSVPLMTHQSARRNLGGFRPPRVPHCDRDPLPYVLTADGGGWNAAQVCVSDDYRRMTCSGIVLDTLDGFGECG